MGMPAAWVRAREEFERNTAEHEMTVLHDDGVYRHVRFQRPGSSFYFYDLVTWPGHLAISGDAGDYVFQRSHDMFEWFAGSADNAWGLNADYWASKLVGAASARDLSQSYSHDVLRARVIDWARDHCDSGYDGDLVYPALLIDAVEREILFGWTHTEHDGRERLDLLEEAVGHLDCWEWDLRELDSRFLWCCWAIARGVERYRAAKPVEAVA